MCGYGLDKNVQYELSYQLNQAICAGVVGLALVRSHTTVAKISMIITPGLANHKLCHYGVWTDGSLTNATNYFSHYQSLA
jgi:hypothetical protein